MYFLFNYTKVLLWSTIYYYYRNDKIYQLILKNIKDSGCIAIKFTQWALPKIEMIYKIDSSKDTWFQELEKFYEYCNIHDFKHTEDIYYQDFSEKLVDHYSIEGIIGSGSIGQVYKITDKNTKKDYALKVIHPNLSYQIHFFKIIIMIINYSPLRYILNKILPIDLYQFIIDFEEQTNMIHETNNCLKFQENYQNNPKIIIPEIYKCSKNILLMSYEEGTKFDDLNTNEYIKFKSIGKILFKIYRNGE